jgi:cytochrome P450
MRLKPVAPVIVFEANRDTAIGGVFIPSGTLLMLLTRPGCMDERNFDHADGFQPERWLEKRSAANNRKASMPFGAGPRMCPGRYLALEEMKMLTSMLVHNFNIKEVTTPDGTEVQERLAFTLAPVNMLARLEKR